MTDLGPAEAIEARLLYAQHGIRKGAHHGAVAVLKSKGKHAISRKNQQRMFHTAARAFHATRSPRCPQVGQADALLHVGAHMHDAASAWPAGQR